MQADLALLPLLLWLLALFVSSITAVWQLIAPKTPLLKWHARFAALGAGAAVLQLLLSHQSTSLPLSASPLAWLLVSLVLLLGLIVQRFCRRFLHGDRDQSRAQAWLALLTSGTALAWVSTDSRLLLAGWGLALFALYRLIGLARDWQAAQAAARFAGAWLLGAWLALCVVIAVTHTQTDSWSTGLPADLAQWPAWAIQLAASALLLAAVIPAAQWPAQRWLLATMVAPTPVSAIMHAGLVNAGGILLVQYGSLLAAAGWAQIALLLLATLSILIGSGLVLVQVDVKRQLAASTVAQMGCMLLQCALGAYVAALIHLLLHGLFKASLFLQAGSTVSAERRALALPSFGRIAMLAALLVAALLWLSPNFAAGPAGWLSALLLAWALAQGLASLPVWHWRSLPFLALVTVSFLVVQASLHTLLAALIPASSPPAAAWVFLAATILLAGTALLYRLLAHPQNPVAQRLYWLLVSLGEAPQHTLDAHPSHLARRAQQGVLA